LTTVKVADHLSAVAGRSGGVANAEVQIFLVSVRRRLD